MQPHNFDISFGSNNERSHQKCLLTSVCNCNKTYIGKTGENWVLDYRNTEWKWIPRLNKLLPEVKHTASLSEHNKSTLTDHAMEENHVIDWAKATVIDRQSALRVLNADSKLNCSHLLTPLRTVQRHHSAQIRVSGNSLCYINLVVVVVVVPPSHQVDQGSCTYL